MGAKNVIVIPQGVDTNIMKNLPKDKELQKKYKVEMSSCKSIELKGFEGSLVGKLS